MKFGYLEQQVRWFFDSFSDSFVEELLIVKYKAFGIGGNFEFVLVLIVNIYEIFSF